MTADIQIPATLYYFPMACPRVTAVALEETGAPYELRLVNLMAGDQQSPDYLAINPNGKVPALAIGNHLITENAAILLYLDAAFPDAKLLPAPSDAIERAQAHSDLIWCATTLHPIARQIRAPYHYTVGDGADVTAKGVQAATAQFARFERRFSASTWWFGKKWSIVDVYIAWAVSGCALAIELDSYPHLVAHSERVCAEPGFKRMLARERKLIADTGMQFPPGVKR